MLCTEIMGNIAERVDAGDPRVDLVSLSWQQALQRAFRARSKGGVELRICVPAGRLLRHGDVLVEDKERIIALESLPGEMLVIRGEDRGALLQAAYLLGDEHLPVEIGEGEVVTPDDPATQSFLRQHGIDWVQEVRRFTPIATPTLAGVGVSSGFEVKRGT